MNALNRTYLDYNAGAPLIPAARAAMERVLSSAGNPSSIHAEGRERRKHVEAARSALAVMLGCSPSQVIFTSGATEAANHALCPIIRAGNKEIRLSRLYVGASEHPCVLSGGRFDADRIVKLPVQQNGTIDLAACDEIFGMHDRDEGAPMVAVMLANNETGVIQPVAEIGERVHAMGGFMLVDAVQGLGRLTFSVSDLNADFVLVSAHKIGGPQGAGALVLGDKAVSPLPLIRGGGQENHHRAGTENVAAIAGFGAAVENLPAIGKCDEVRGLRDFIEAGLATISKETDPFAREPVIFGRDTERLCNTCCFAMPGIRAETALISLDLAGIAVSSGSACSSGKVRKSHVLEAMGVPDDLAECALRISIGAETDLNDARRLLDAWRDIVRLNKRATARVAV